MFNKMTYGERLALARTRAGLTQKELSVKVGMQQPSLAHLEKKGKSSAFTVKLAHACGVNVDWLDDEIGEMAPDDSELQQARAEYLKNADAATVENFRHVYLNASEAGRDILRVTLEMVNANYIPAEKRLDQTIMRGMVVAS